MSGRSRRWAGSSSNRQSSTWFITGRNSVKECLNSPHIDVDEVWIDGAAEKWWRSLALPKKSRCDLTVTRVARSQTPRGTLVQGVGVAIQAPVWGQIDDLLGNLFETGRNPLVLALDQVEDPMNLGQIIRTAEGAGVDFIILPKDRAAPYNQTVAQVSQGAFAWLPVVIVSNLRQALETLKDAGIWVFGCQAGAKATPWHEADLTLPLALVLGSEGGGLRRLTAKTCDGLLELPMAGHLDSLNVSASAAAFLYEAARQRRV